jgi:hypothetical protein
MSNPTRFLGIDPGASGGFCLIQPDGVIRPTGMLKTEWAVWEYFRALSSLPGVVAVIEKVGGYVGGKGQPGSAMFNFGMSYGGLRMALVASGILFDDVTPQRWMASLDLPPRKKSQSKTEWKNQLKGIAQALYPETRITLSTADAVLLAEYARIRYTS